MDVNTNPDSSPCQVWDTRRSVARLKGLQKFWRLSWRDRLLLVEATLWLAVAGFAIAALPFRYVGYLAARPTRRSKPSQETRHTDEKRIRWSIVATARRVPWRAACFQQGLAAQFMLRRRGVPSVLYYGAAPDHPDGLSAHVWVRDGDTDVIGGGAASRYAVLTTFPLQANEGSSSNNSSSRCSGYPDREKLKVVLLQDGR
jgi:Transglutaminase-like superfamily